MSKILYVWNYREWGGAQIYYLSLMKAALRGEPGTGNKAQCEVAAIVPKDSDARVLEYLGELGVPVEFCDPAPPAAGPKAGFFNKLRHRLRVFRSENRLASHVLNICGRGSGPVIIHIDVGFWQSYRALARLCRRANVFVTQHTALVDPGGLRGTIWRLKGKRISRLPNFVILASNNDAKRSLRRFLTPEKFNSIKITYTGVDPEEIQGVQRSRENAAVQPPAAAAGGSSVVMTVGQFIERKGCWVVLDALKKLRGAGQDVQFAWLGTSALDPETQERITSYGLGDTFRFLAAEEIGPARSDLLGLLSTADIFVLASLREGLPIALVEAMALGLPCIASRVGAIPEAIDHDASGLLVEPGDADALAGAIRTLIHDEETRQMFGKAARAIAFEKFDQRATAEETIAIYNNIWQTRG